MEFVVMASGSNGNCNLLKAGKDYFLIDAGLSFLAIRKLLKNQNVDINDIKGVFVTHSHSDHVKGLKALAKELPALPIFGGSDIVTCATSPGFCEIGEKKSFENFEVETFSVSHDVPCKGYNFISGNEKISYVTDLGIFDEFVFSKVKGAKTVMIESNFDQNLLEKGSYPFYLKRRISSITGHMSNENCKEACKSLLSLGTENFILSHLSKNNNNPETAYSETDRALREMGASPQKDYHLTVAPRFGDVTEVLNVKYEVLKSCLED